MSMTEDALKYVTSLVPPTMHADPEGREYSDRPLTAVVPPLVTPVTVSTLSGFCDVFDAGTDIPKQGGVMALVKSETEVHLLSASFDSWNRRPLYVVAKLTETTGFRFKEWHDHEAFVIGLLAHFAPTPDREFLAQLAKYLTSERVRTSQDDGISQEVTVRKGVSIKTTETPRNRVQLAPYRTFREIEQPASEFLFRLRDGAEGEPPNLTLLESDGGKWKLSAMEEIGRFLRVRLVNTPVAI